MTQINRSRLHRISFFLQIILFLFQYQYIEAQILSPGTPNPRSTRDVFIKTARSYIGTPYTLGGISRSGMDCSGFIYTVASESLSLALPRRAQDMATYCTKISDEAREPGDLLFFGSTNTISHVAIYLGVGTFIHAASDGPRTGVIISDLGETYWRKTYQFAGRFLAPEKINWPSPENSSTTDRNPLPEPHNPQTRTPKPFDGKIGFSLQLHGTGLWDLMPNVPPIRGANFETELRWVRGVTVYPGIGVGFTFDSRTASYSIPFTFSISTMEGFRFYIGTQFHLLSDPDLDKKPQFPGIIGFAWNSPEAKVFGQNLGFYQAVEYSWFPNETLGTGFRFSTGLSLRYSL